jgi:hypothetical protein
MKRRVRFTARLGRIGTWQAAPLTAQEGKAAGGYGYPSAGSRNMFVNDVTTRICLLPDGQAGT